LIYNLLASCKIIILKLKQVKNIFDVTVKDLCIKKGITQEQLAECLNLQPQTITTIETGRMFVSSEVLANLSNFFEVDPTIFFAKKPRILTEEDLDYIKEIKRLLPSFSTARLRDIYNILLVLQK